MKRTNRYILLLLIIIGLAAPNIAFSETAVLDTQETQQAVELPKAAYPGAVNVNPIDLVKNPENYINKTVVMNGRFDKFSTVGLDYPPALRKMEDYISFMIYRDDTLHNIPLSELKLFMKRDDAQKFIDLKAKDSVKITGKVFSAALGDPWVDVLSLEIIKK